MLFLFHGENNYLTNQKVNHWRTEFVKKFNTDTNISVLEGNETSSASLFSECETLPFLAEKRLIIVKNFLQKAPAEEQKNLAEKLKNMPDFTVLVFAENETADKRTTLYKKIAKLGQTEEFAPLIGEQLTAWIIAQVKKLNGNISLQSANYLTSTAGNNLWILEQEIKKLALYTKNREITISDIDKLTSANLTSSIFKLTDSLGQKQASPALKTLHYLIDMGEDIMMIFHMIVRHFRILIQIRDLADQKKDRKEIGLMLKLHPFVLMKGLQQTKNFDLKKLTAIYQNLLDIEIGLKNGKIKISTDDHRELVLALNKFIINCIR